jgi:thiol-disulfide isomerase/thioredoxin
MKAGCWCPEPALAGGPGSGWLGRCLLGLALAWACALAAAEGMPPGYGAMSLPVLRSPGRTEFDLNPALQRARREGKPLYLYLGASDCPYCRRYEAFLAKNEAELLPHFRKYLLAEMRSSLSVNARELHVKVGARSYSYTEWMQALGDERARMLVYPSVWLLDTTPKPLMQMPAGTGTFETVEEQLEVLRLEN